ncbi:MAG: rod shape-determining protein RodA [Muribaculaceae bacterium]
MYNNDSYGNTSSFRNIDWITVLIYAALVVAGAVSIYAASYDFDQASMFDFSEFSGKQFLWIGLSFVIGFSILLIDRRMIEAYAYPVYGLMILVLIVTIFIAPDIKGSRSWLVLGPVSLQPAEFAKFATALALAKLFSGYNFVLNKSFANYIKCALIIGLPIVLILAQKDTGSALVYLALVFVLYREGMSGFVLFAALSAVVIFVVSSKYADTLTMGIPTGEFIIFIYIMVVMVGMLLFYCRSLIICRNITIAFIASAIIAFVLHLFGINIPGLAYFLTMIFGAIAYLLIAMFHDNMRRILVTISFAVASIVFLFSVNYVFNNILQPHQQMRIKVALGIEQDLRGAGYNVNQSKIAIGSGGISGKGFLNGTQTKLKYVPEQHTDFIFCTIGEEEGFLGTTAVLAAFLYLILRIITIAERQRSSFGRIYGYSVASYLIFHLGINVGMVIGLCPVIGIPLPFFSYGGSSLWGFTILLFILLRLDSTRTSYGNY